MTRYSSDAVMGGLKDFQRRTVDHVIGRFHGSDPTRRFLVADETGLGKSVVARGVIAKTLERLQYDDTVDRIDVIYVCSNQDIATQNLARLKVTTGETITLTSRLTLLALHSSKLRAATATEGKPVNLVAFTPGTSFDRGWRTGRVEERALIFLLLEQMLKWDGWTRRAALRALQGTTRTPARFEQQVNSMSWDLRDGIDRDIAREFGRSIRASGLLREVRKLLDDIGRRNTLPDDLRERGHSLVGRLRADLARSGVHTLEPDLIILDEFQRFRHLLDVEQGGESAELAHHLFDFGNAKVLLLSATPYKPYTLAEESSAGDDHWADLRLTLRFLCDDPTWNADVEDGFRSYREALVRGTSASDARERLQSLLLRVMTRTERPRLGQDGMLRERLLPADGLTSDDVRAYTVMRRVATTVNAPMSLEYWKSAPYFLNFTEGYQLGTKLRKALGGPLHDELDELLRTAQALDRGRLERFEPIDLGNARLRQLAGDTVDQGWWRLLWVPPSMPYYRLGSPFEEAAAAGMTKRLLFSSWNATPTAVAGLLSYEAERRIFADSARGTEVAERRRVAPRLEYRLESGRPAGMSTLALFWPHPALATLCDPRSAAEGTYDRDLREVEQMVAARITQHAPPELVDPSHSSEMQPWQVLLRWPGSTPDDLDDHLATSALFGGEDEEAGVGLEGHVRTAVDTIRAQALAVSRSADPVAVELVALGMHSPANIAWRALGRVRDSHDGITDVGHWHAAGVVASGLRSLFNRPESIMLLDRLYPGETYWRAVLRYSAAGGLQAVMDEYVHHLRGAMSDLALDDQALLSIAQDMVGALSLRPSVYRAFDPGHPESTIPLNSRFALRYGGRRDDAEGARQPEVRAAFNSPFWPFVVATTSAGQEGIDFHWWCSSVVHWNTPANPVDFEQREGRVHRFGGHAVRRNVAARYRQEALDSPDRDAWRAAYEAARRTVDDLGEFAPYWVYPGHAKVERLLMPYPLSRDVPKVQRLKDDLVMYRLAFGQPRQEDLLALLGRSLDSEDVAGAALDLRPPRRA